MHASAGEGKAVVSYFEKYISAMSHSQYGNKTELYYSE